MNLCTLFFCQLAEFVHKLYTRLEKMLLDFADLTPKLKAEKKSVIRGLYLQLRAGVVLPSKARVL